MECQFLVEKFLDPETDIMDQFMDPETDTICQFLDPETDIMGERTFMQNVHKVHKLT